MKLILDWQDRSDKSEDMKQWDRMQLMNLWTTCRSSHAEEGKSKMRPNKGRRVRKKMCAFCADKVESIDYKDVSKLRKHISERGKILQKDHGNCAKHQRQLTSAIKARILHYCLSLPNKINAHIKTDDYIAG